MPTNPDLEYRQAVAAEESVLLEQAKRNEKAYVASIRTEVPASGGTTNLSITNPSGSGVQAHILDMTVRAQFEGLVDIHDVFSSVPSNGTQGIIDNLLLDTENGSPDVGSMTIRQDAAFTAAGQHALDVLPGGGPGGSIGGASTATEPIIRPDRHMAIEVTNQSGTADDVAITLVYIEEPIEA